MATHGGGTYTASQQAAIGAFSTFLEGGVPVFMLKGYAGTGKTFMLNHLYGMAEAAGFEPLCMAPTGRAAKVVRDKTGIHAATIHSSIYNLAYLHESKIRDDAPADERESTTFKYHFAIKRPQYTGRPIVFVDEASMVSDQASDSEFFRFGSGRLLRDLLEYAAIGHSTMRPKVVFVGDPAQLPPVDMGFSPCFDAAYLEQEFGLPATEVVLTDIVRQAEGSRLVQVSLPLRQAIEQEVYNTFRIEADGNEIVEVPGKQAFIGRYIGSGARSVMIAYMNSTVHELNRLVRMEKYPGEEVPQPGDRVLVVRNNYLHGLLNGELGVLASVSPFADEAAIPLKSASRGNRTIVLKWRHVEAVFPGPNEDMTFKGLILENLLDFWKADYAGTAKLKELVSDLERALYIEFKMRNKHLKEGTTEFSQALRTDKRFMALRLQYGYAITCHKAQGGEWPEVYLAWDIDTRMMQGNSFYRWAYTAVTRASSQLFMLNAPEWNPLKGMVWVRPSVQPEMEAMRPSPNRVPEKRALYPEELATQLLEPFGLIEMPLPVQEKFLVLEKLFCDAGFRIADVAHRPFQETYSVSRGNEAFRVVLYYNKGHEFKDTPTYSGPAPAEATQTEVEALVRQAAGCYVSSGETGEFQLTDEASTGNIRLESDHVRFLHDVLTGTVSMQGIRMAPEGMKEYSIRYRFSKDGGKAIVDFHWNSKGRFTTAQPTAKSDPGLQATLEDIVKSISSN